MVANYRRIFTVLIVSYFVFYAIVSLYNLAYLPVAWFDETFFMDPAIQFLNTGRYVSKTWYLPGTDVFCFGHMPLMGVIHILNLSVVPWEIFYARLPFVLLSLVGFYFYFRFLKEGLGLDFFVCILALFIFVNDKSTSEALRSMRPETLELFLIPIVFWRVYTKRNVFLTSFLLSLLALSHPKSWAIVLVLGSFLVYQEPSWNKRFLISSIFLMPIVSFFAWGKFDFELFRIQLLSHASDHGTDSAQTDNIFYNHFIGRFFPYYATQPYTMIVFYLSAFYAFKSIVRTKEISSNLLEICFLLTNVYWFLQLGGFPRYNTVLMWMSYAIFFKNVGNVVATFFDKKYAYLIALLLFPVVCFPFLSRHGAAILQRNEREIGKILTWYDTIFADKAGKKVLLIEDSSAHYYAINHKGFDFGFLYTIHKFQFRDYDEVFVCTHEPLTHPEIKKLDEYKLETVSLLKESGSKAFTYNETIVYQVLSKDAFEYLKTDVSLFGKE